MVTWVKKKIKNVGNWETQKKKKGWSSRLGRMIQRKGSNMVVEGHGCLMSQSLSH